MQNFTEMFLDDLIINFIDLKFKPVEEILWSV
jgi:hypothetical protein